jgi:hypothetical protein
MVYEQACRPDHWRSDLDRSRNRHRLCQRKERVSVVSGRREDEEMPNAHLIIYPDSNDGAHDQYPELFVRHVSDFLSEWGGSSIDDPLS